MNSGMPELGSKISLISKADIRYEGRLFTVDPQECTIALASGKFLFTASLLLCSCVCRLQWIPCPWARRHVPQSIPHLLFYLLVANYALGWGSGVGLRSASVKWSTFVYVSPA